MAALSPSPKMAVPNGVGDSPTVPMLAALIPAVAILGTLAWIVLTDKSEPLEPHRR
jgi:hypothetical protein